MSKGTRESSHVGMYYSNQLSQNQAFSRLLLKTSMYDVHIQAKPILDDGKYSQLLDPTLRDNNNNNDDQMQRMALAATLCIRRSPQARPKMSIVSQILYLLAFSNKSSV